MSTVDQYTGAGTETDGHAPVLDNSGFRVNDLTAKAENPPQEPEVLVDVWQGENELDIEPGLTQDDTSEHEFVRIPVTKVELWENKDGPSDLNRTAKVMFPGEWGGIDVQQFVQGFNSDDSATYDVARIWFYDAEEDNYQITHFGYVGGVGPASKGGTFKFWVYDPADLLKSIPVSKSFSEPTIGEVLSFATSGTDANGEPVGLANRTVFERFAPIKTHLTSLQSYQAQVERAEAELNANLPGDPDVNFDTDTTIGVGQYKIDIRDALEQLFGEQYTNVIIGGQKSFKRNRHSMVDLLNWATDQVGGKWHFEPTPSGPVLWVGDGQTNEENDEILTRRTFVDEELTDEDGTQVPDDVTVFDTVTTLDNNALRDMKPFNTLRLYGESRRAARYASLNQSSFADAASSSALGEAFPYVEVTYPPLLQRADSHQYMKEIESDKKYLDAAEKEVKKQFRQSAEEETEGSMTLKGEPYILPYDYILNIPVCQRTFPNIDTNTMRYEVNSVKHTRATEERYKTELGVSLALEESKLQVEAEYKPA